MQLFVLLIAVLLSFVYAQENFKFTDQLYNQTILSEEESNVVLSPLLVESLLMQIYMGTDGRTQTELEEVMLLGEIGDKSEVIKKHLQILKKITDSIKKRVKVPPVISLNRILVNIDLKVDRKYMKALGKRFGSSIATQRFWNGFDNAQKPNRWFATKTNNKVTDVIQNEYLDENTAVIAVNVMYFKDRWAQAFNKSLTKREKFQINEDEDSKVKMMTSNAMNVRYGQLEDIGAEAVQLPFESGLKMLILLPPADGLLEMEKKLFANSTDIIGMAKGLAKQDGVTVSLPKFKINFGMDFKPVLENMGVYRLFLKADLSSMVTPKLSWPNKIYISNIIHKVVFEVDEDGGEQADDEEEEEEENPRVDFDEIGNGESEGNNGTDTNGTEGNGTGTDGTDPNANGNNCTETGGIENIRTGTNCTETNGAGANGTESTGTEFIVNRPFMFAVYDSKNVLFYGRVVYL